METRNCIVCGRAFIPLSANGKYCSVTCADKGQSIRRREWETRSGYREKRRIQAQERRNAIKAAAEADRAESAKKAEQKRNRQNNRRRKAARNTLLQAAQQGDALARLMLATATGGNKTPEYWNAFAAYDLQRAADFGKESRTEVNGIPVQAEDFGRLVCESIIDGKPIITRVRHERKPAK